MRQTFVALIFFANLIIPLKASADCICACVGGEVQAICSSTLDLAPICAPKICPLTTPSIKPLDSLELAPLGTTSCTNEQVYNYSTGRYEWTRLCN